MRFHLWYKKLSQTSERQFECDSDISAFNEAHEILRGFYATSEQNDVDSGTYKFFNSQGELVGLLTEMSKQEQEQIRPKKGLVTFADLIASKSKKNKNDRQVSRR